MIQYLGIAAGFLVILAAAGLAFKQSLSWKHVVVFFVGGALASLSALSLRADGSGIAVNLGNVVQAVEQTGKAADENAKALASLNDRLTKAENALAAAQKVSDAQAGSGAPPAEVAEARAQTKAFLRDFRTIQLNSNRQLQAATTQSAQAEALSAQAARRLRLSPAQAPSKGG